MGGGLIFGAGIAPGILWEDSELEDAVVPDGPEARSVVDWEELDGVGGG